MVLVAKVCFGEMNGESRDGRVFAGDVETQDSPDSFAGGEVSAIPEFFDFVDSLLSSDAKPSTVRTYCYC